MLERKKLERFPATACGEHAEDIRRELGYSDCEIVTLRA
jgi:hypothetical protein